MKRGKMSARNWKTLSKRLLAAAARIESRPERRWDLVQSAVAHWFGLVERASRTEAELADAPDGPTREKLRQQKKDARATLDNCLTHHGYPAGSSTTCLTDDQLCEILVHQVRLQLRTRRKLFSNKRERLGARTDVKQDVEREPPLAQGRRPEVTIACKQVVPEFLRTLDAELDKSKVPAERKALIRQLTPYLLDDDMKPEDIVAAAPGMNLTRERIYGLRPTFDRVKARALEIHRRRLGVQTPEREGPTTSPDRRRGGRRNGEREVIVTNGDKTKKADSWLDALELDDPSKLTGPLQVLEMSEDELDAALSEMPNGQEDAAALAELMGLHAVEAPSVLPEVRSATAEVLLPRPMSPPDGVWIRARYAAGEVEVSSRCDAQMPGCLRIEFRADLKPDSSAGLHVYRVSGSSAPVLSTKISTGSGTLFLRREKLAFDPQVELLRIVFD